MRCAWRKSCGAMAKGFAAKKISNVGFNFKGGEFCHGGKQSLIMMSSLLEKGKLWE